MKLFRHLAALVCVGASFGAHAGNLLTNGSFESGLAGWTITGGGSDPVSVKNYGNSFYGETVLADSSVSLSPDAAGAKAIYFVDDVAYQTLTQTVTVATAGSYSVGFSTYAPANGWANAHDAAFSASIGGNTIFSSNISGMPITTWEAKSGLVNLTAGSHDISFTFTPTGAAGKDLVIDRVYLVAAPVPEPETYAMLLAGLGVLGWARRRQSKSV
ncbi:PEP-CTERM sorting domain-containing protein [Rhodoferax sp.]|uniref:PEP-CTERM sorting domain-containing protein n=1 Tax=Rhodoferax sp. TaxID=50421 RepID=UPI00262231B0|nr:PEP-CTERM sorting domain-containing protein [Rhodoferax sp.]MDD5481054.1 PEP-CTERM sorting domain-containing protein [Rhodoferax sp.]